MTGVNEIFVSYRGQMEEVTWTDKVTKEQRTQKSRRRLIYVCLLVDISGRILTRAFSVGSDGGKFGSKDRARRRAYFALLNNKNCESLENVNVKMRSGTGRHGVLRSKNAIDIIVNQCGQDLAHFTFKMIANPTMEYITQREVEAVQHWISGHVDPVDRSDEVSQAM